MDYIKTKVYFELMEELNKTNTPELIKTNLSSYARDIYESDLKDKYSEPMVVIGMYIALASLGCVIAMVADLLHGLRSSKLWFPTKYFPINAFSLTVIAVAMKLPVDLSGSMPGSVDQVGKLGSMAFMCTIMANFLPYLAKMDSKVLLTNITALGVLVITLLVNICIQVETGVVGKIPNDEALELNSRYDPDDLEVFEDLLYTTVALIYVVLLLSLLIIHVSSSLVILKSKQIIEPIYQQAHEIASKDLQQDPETAANKVQESIEKSITIEKLRQHVSNYWIMAGSSNPQFIIACSATTTAAGVICLLSAILHCLIITVGEYRSDYNWSMPVILIVQFIGVLLGTVAPVLRCFAYANFKLSIKCIINHIKVFKVEKYWTQKLSDWKYGCISLPFGIRSHKLQVVIKNLRNLILNFCIILQMGLVVVYKTIALIPFFITICLRCLKWLLQTVFGLRASGTENLEQRKYVLQLENEKELAERTLKGLLKSLNQLIRKSEKKQPKNLIKLITERSTEGFKGVRKYDNNDERDCWSLSVVTLTTIAITLPNIEKAKVKSLLKSVREGLHYITLVEKNLNAIDDYVNIQKAAAMLWEEVNFRHKWLGIKLIDIASQVNATTSQVDTTPQIVQLFLEKANKIKDREGNMNIKGPDGYFECIDICANSMSRITQTIIDDKESHKKLFDELSSRIADIMAACLTNLPQVISMKCHTNVIEKREASVQAAAALLGETTEIINKLQADYKVPSMNIVDDLPFIDKWRAYLSEP